MRDTIDMARKVKMPYDFVTGEPINLQKLKAFAELVRADEREQGQKWFDAVTAQHKQLILAEREACAKVCDELSPPCGYNLTEISFWDVTSLECAAAIRNRGQALFTAPPAQPATVQEPVALVGSLNEYSAMELVNRGFSLTDPLYTTPPAAQPAVPDALTIADKESPDYHEGWNDCRAAMLEMRKP
jgi:hypothetical protein